MRGQMFNTGSLQVEKPYFRPGHPPKKTCRTVPNINSKDTTPGVVHIYSSIIKFCQVFEGE